MKHTTYVWSPNGQSKFMLSKNAVQGVVAATISPCGPISADRYVNLVYSQYYRKKITIDSVAEYLQIKVEHLPAFERFFMGG